MSSENGPYREPAAPDPVKRVTLPSSFDRGHGKAQEAASVTTARGALVLGVVSLAYGAVTFFSVTRVIDAFRDSANEGGCLCHAMPFILLGLVTTIAYVAGSMKAISHTKSARAKARAWEEAFREVRAFNAACLHVNGQIRNFDRFAVKEKHRIVEKAAALAERRPQIVALTEKDHG